MQPVKDSEKHFISCWLLGSCFIQSTLPCLHSTYDLEDLVQVAFCASQNWLYVVNYRSIRIYSTVLLKTEPEHTGTWLAAAWPPCWLLSPSSIPPQLPSHLTFIPAMRSPVHILKSVTISIFFTFKFCAKVMLFFELLLWGEMPGQTHLNLLYMLCRKA